MSLCVAQLSRAQGSTGKNNKPIHLVPRPQPVARDVRLPPDGLDDARELEAGDEGACRGCGVLLVSGLT